MYWTGGISPAVHCGIGGDNKPHVLIVRIKPPSNITSMEYKEKPTKLDLIEYFSNRIDIRKITEVEALRLMDVSDKDIEEIRAFPFESYDERSKFMASADKKEVLKKKREGICKTSQYRLAGNSIVVNCLYHIFRTLLVPNQPEYNKQQLTLF